MTVINICESGAYRLLLEVQTLLEQALASMASIPVKIRTNLQRTIRRLLADRESWLQSYLLKGDPASLLEGTESGSGDSDIGAIVEVSCIWVTMLT